jgi:hypothetical protein
LKAENPISGKANQFGGAVFDEASPVDHASAASATINTGRRAL